MITGIILAAGQSKRYGLENGVGKCFAKIRNKFLIEYPVCTLKNIKVKPIVIGVNPRDEPIARSVFHKHDNVEIKLSCSKGTAGCLKDLLTPEITKGIVLYGDTVYMGSIKNFAKVLLKVSSGWATIGVQQTNKLQDYMAIVRIGRRYKPIIKPHRLKTGLAYIGLLGFNDHLILSKLSSLDLSKRGELELTDLIGKYATLNRLELGFYNSDLVDCNTREKVSGLRRLLK